MSKVIVQQSFEEKKKSVLVGLVSFKEIYKKVRVSYRTEESGAEYQRQIEEERVKSIAKYIVRCISANEKGGANLVFPNSIILACPNESESPKLFTLGEYLDIEVPEHTMIVDGQHRYSGVKYLYEEALRSSSVYGYNSETIIKYLNAFNFSCTILVNYDMWEQAQIFANVNFNQKKVNKSLFYDIYGVSIPLDDTNTIPRQNEIYLAHELVVFLENDSSSAFNGFVKMLGKGFGYVSQAFLVESFLKHLSAKGIWSDAVEMLKRGDLRYKYIAHELLAYMAAIRFTFKSIWPEEVEDKPSSVLCKTTGVGAIIALLKDAHIAMPKEDVKEIRENAFSPLVYAKNITFFTNYLRPLKPHGETLFALKGEFARGAGGGMQNSLYLRMKEIINGEK